MSYSKKNHKYIKKYRNANGNWTYVYNYSLDKNGRIMYGNGDKTGRRTGYTRNYDGIINRITGSEYKKLADDAKYNANEYKRSISEFESLKNKYEQSDRRGGKTATEKRNANRVWDDANKSYKNAKSYKKHNDDVARYAKARYRDYTVAGALGKVKNKAKFTTLKAQRKVSKLLKKLSKKN